MPRFPTHGVEDAPAASRPLLKQFKQKMGRVPNVFGAMAGSPAVLDFFDKADQALGKGVLHDSAREAIALAVGANNCCVYCMSAHGAKARSLGVEAAEMERNLAGGSQDAHTGMLVAFARAISDKQGWAGDDLEQARGHGISDEELIEVIALVALNLFTNYFNHINETDVDFPLIELPE